MLNLADLFGIVKEIEVSSRARPVLVFTTKSSPTGRRRIVVVLPKLPRMMVVTRLESVLAALNTAPSSVLSSHESPRAVIVTVIEFPATSNGSPDCDLSAIVRKSIPLADPNHGSGSLFSSSEKKE